MPGPIDRFCRGCGHPLAGLRSPICPECGRGFDPDDPRTTVDSPKPWRRTIAALVRPLIVFNVLVAISVVVANGRGFDPLLGYLIAIGLSPVLLLPLAAVPFPSLPLKRRWRVLAVLAPLAILTTLLTDWPVRAAFEFHRSSFVAEADRIRANPTPAATGAGVGDLRSGPTRVGAFSVLQIRETPDGNLGFQLTGNAGGGVYLVEAKPGSRFIWWNTNWETDLGGGWWLVYQD